MKFINGRDKHFFDSKGIANSKEIAITNKRIRFPNDMIRNIEINITDKDCTFSDFVVNAVRSALDDIKED